MIFLPLHLHLLIELQSSEVFCCMVVHCMSFFIYCPLLCHSLHLCLYTVSLLPSFFSFILSFSFLYFFLCSMFVFSSLSSLYPLSPLFLLPSITASLCGHWVPTDWSLSVQQVINQPSFFLHTECRGCRSRRPWHVLVGWHPPPSPLSSCSHSQTHEPCLHCWAMCVSFTLCFLILWFQLQIIPLRNASVKNYHNFLQLIIQSTGQNKSLIHILKVHFVFSLTSTTVGSINAAGFF